MSTTDNTDKPSKDLLHTWSALWLWCLPIVIVIAANGLYSGQRLSFTATGSLLTVATFWIGAACYANGRSCGRLHCKVDGILLPILGISGVLNLLHAITISWTTYTNLLTGIVILSFVAEWLNNAVNHRSGGAPIC